MTDHRVITQVHRLLTSIKNVASTIALTLVIVIMAPIVEGQFMPVVKDVEVVYLGSEQKNMLFTIQANKMRQCRLVSLRTLVTKKGNDKTGPVNGLVQTLTDIHDTPNGIQDLGFWSVTPEGEEVIVNGTWQCHPFWETRQLIGTWKKSNTKE